MKAVKNLLLIDILILALLSLTGCVVISCDESCAPADCPPTAAARAAMAEETCIPHP